MAQGRVSMGWLGWIIAVISAMTLLVSTGVWNPFPGLWDWVNTERPLSEPDSLWQEKLDGVPKNVYLLEKHAVLEHGGSVEVRSRSTGRQVWKSDADWAATAGGYVVSGKLLVKGYEVRDPATGAVVRKDEKAAAVWTFADAMIDVSCRSARDCELIARVPDSGRERWRVLLPGIGFVLFADNPGLAGSAPITPLASPGPMPRLLGFPIDNRVHVVDTGAGKALPVVTPAQHTAVHVLGGRVIHSTATPRNGRCILSVVGRQGHSGNEVWRREGYSVLELNGAGCQLRGEPVAGGNAVVAIRPDGREALLDAGDGREVLTVGEDEKVLATDGVHAVVRKGTRLLGYRLGRGGPLWERDAHKSASVVITRGAVIVSDRSPDRVVVLDPATGDERGQVRSGARVVAFDPVGFLLADRRQLGYLEFSTLSQRD
jgi:outer membrane protein assembly factor BamB